VPARPLAPATSPPEHGRPRAEHGATPVREVLAAGMAVVVLRLATSARYPTEWDSANLVLGAEGFDVTVARPHPPGYWLYARLGWLVQAVTPADTHLALVLVAAAASGLAVALALVVGWHLGGRMGGWSAAALVGTWPIGWFYGSIVSTYTVDLVLSLAFVLLLIRARPGGTQLWAGAALAGVASGFRPSALFLAGPALGLLAWRCTARPVTDGTRSLPWAVGQVAVAAGALGLAVVAWLVPLAVDQPGGLAAWVDETRHAWSEASAATSTFAGAAAAPLNRDVALTHSALAVVPAIPLLALAALAMVRGAVNRPPSDLARFAGFALVVGGPLFAVSWLVHYPKTGYLLAYAPLVLVVGGGVAGTVTGRWRTAAGSLVVVAAAGQAVLFAGTDALLPQRLADRLPAVVADWAADSLKGAPYPYTWHAIRLADDEGRAFARLAARVDAERDVVVFLDVNGGRRFRQATALLGDVPVLYLGGTEQADPWIVHASFGGDLRDGGPVPGLASGGRVYAPLDYPSGHLAALAADGRLGRLPLAPPPPQQPVAEPSIWVVGGLEDPLDLWRPDGDVSAVGP
jgi:hypothetical protein